MIAAELIKRGAKYFSNETAVIYKDQKLTFNEVHRNSNRLANALFKLGLEKGDRISFLLANSIHSVEIDFAMLKSGLVRVPLNTRLSEEEQFHMITETDSKAILFTEEFSGRVASLRERLSGVSLFCQVDGDPNYDWIIPIYKETKTVTDEDPVIPLSEEDYATLQYTSGTTGRLKAAIHTQGSWAAMAANILATLTIERGDIMMHAAPLTHASGILVLPHWIRGAANAILPTFHPQEFLQAIEEIKPTTLNLVPTMIVMLLSHPDVEKYSFDSVRSLIYGASPMPREALKRGLELWGPKFIQYYGQTEAPLILTILPVEDHILALKNPDYYDRLLSCGRPIITTEVKIVNEQGDELPDGEIGEICVASSQAMSGYWKEEALTEETIKGKWIFTRDMGYIDQEGYVYLVERKSDMIISGGFNIYPREVEEVLYKHPAVLEAAIVGVADEKWVESVKAFVVLKEGYQVSEQEIIDHCKEQLASYKKPKYVEFIDSLPKSAVGKVVRRMLRKEELRR
ncbi:class I adenylate-forming enzyme family protein [Bacillus sp. T33-2]|uniref:class I adenylate-forming enzyme family protein n=1 Tax=Bacillus sp. T33-2 TaxID=2054168 RepID=UPI000C777FC5|nr:AMP-binding protein [Bacillus sp. T33-2]PLR98480.1 AMP-dependent synthetase [Bacillus sp. T33-2]